MLELLASVERNDLETVRKVLRELVSGYVPQGEIVDLLYVQRKSEIANI